MTQDRLCDSGDIRSSSRDLWSHFHSTPVLEDRIHTSPPCTKLRALRIPGDGVFQRACHHPLFPAQSLTAPQGYTWQGLGRDRM